MICPNCHKENEKGSLFCMFCGTSMGTQNSLPVTSNAKRTQTKGEKRLIKISLFLLYFSIIVFALAIASKFCYQESIQYSYEDYNSDYYSSHETPGIGEQYVEIRIYPLQYNALMENLDLFLGNEGYECSNIQEVNLMLNGIENKALEEYHYNINMCILVMFCITFILFLFHRHVIKICTPE